MEKEGFLKEVEIKDKLGEGKYGSVYLLEKDNEKEAMKVIDILPKNKEQNLILGISNQKELEDKANKFIQEVKMLYLLKGETHIVNYIDHYIEKTEDKYTLYLEMEYLKSLNSQYPDNIETKQILKLLYDVLDALIICENNDIVHGDIKPDNIMVDDKGNHKLTDFGIAKVFNENIGINEYTDLYASPEVINERKYSKQSDIYSLGLMIYQLFNDGLLPFMKKDTKIIDREKLIQKRINEELDKPKGMDKEFFGFIQKALKNNPEERFDNAQEMKEELQQLEKGNHIPLVIVSIEAFLLKNAISNIFGMEKVGESIAKTEKKASMLKQTAVKAIAKKVIIAVATLSLGIGAAAMIQTNFGQGTPKTEMEMIIQDAHDDKEEFELLIQNMEENLTSRHYTLKRDSLNRPDYSHQGTEWKANNKINLQVIQCSSEAYIEWLITDRYVALLWCGPEYKAIYSYNDDLNDDWVKGNQLGINDSWYNIKSIESVEKKSPFIYTVVAKSVSDVYQTDENGKQIFENGKAVVEKNKTVYHVDDFTFNEQGYIVSHISYECDENGVKKENAEKYEWTYDHFNEEINENTILSEMESKQDYTLQEIIDNF